MKVQTTWKWFTEFTSIGGIGQIVTSKERKWKLFWIIATFIFMSSTIFQSIKVFKEFLEYDVTTKLSVEDEDTMQMPSLTICNNNRIHCGNLFNKILCLQEKSEKKMETFCKIFILSGCDISVGFAELQQTGNVTSDVNICQDFIDDMTEIFNYQKELNLDAIQSTLFELYLQIETVGFPKNHIFMANVPITTG